MYSCVRTNFLGDDTGEVSFFSSTGEALVGSACVTSDSDAALSLAFVPESVTAF